MTKPLPAWADYLLLPALNLAAALVISGLVVLAVGEDPILAIRTLVDGVAGDPEGVGFTLYYATTFIFTGLAVAVPFHAGLFNIGGEGQAMLGGLGVTLVCLGLPGWPLLAVLPLALLAALLFGALYQGGSELAFEMPKLQRELVVVIEGLVILFCGALEHLFRPHVARLFGGSGEP